MTERRNRSFALLVAGMLGGLMGAPSWALDPQPEVPSKPGALAPTALNPQPEVPSKAQKGAQKKKSAKPPGSASGS